MKKIINSLIVLGALLVSSPVWAAAESAGAYDSIGRGLGIGLAVIGAALGLGKAAVAVLEGISRNPSAADKMFVPYILGCAFIEGLAFGLIFGAF